MASNQQPNGSSAQEGDGPNDQPNQASGQEDRLLTDEEEIQYQQMRVVNSARQIRIALWIQNEANRIMDVLRNQLPPREDWALLKTSTKKAFFKAVIFSKKNVCLSLPPSLPLSINNFFTFVRDYLTILFLHCFQHGLHAFGIVPMPLA